MLLTVRQSSNRTRAKLLTGLCLLLHVGLCGKYGLEHLFYKKSAVIIVRNSFVKDFTYPSFVLNGESIK